MKETFYRIDAGMEMRLALITDIHNRRGLEVIRSLKDRRPDMILLAGDLVQRRRSEIRNGEIINRNVALGEKQENVLPFLRDCRAVAPVFMSLGNHEWMLSGRDLEDLKETGAVILDNEYVRKGELVLGGLTSGGFYGYKKKPRSEWLGAFEKEPGLRLLLCHDPEYWALRQPFLRDRDIDLVLSGHAHGGQIRIFGHGLFSPDQGLIPKYTGGMFTGPNGRMIVSRGLSNTVPVPRLGNPTELIYIDLV